MNSIWPGVKFYTFDRIEINPPAEVTPPPSPLYRTPSAGIRNLPSRLNSSPLNHFILKKKIISENWQRWTGNHRVIINYLPNSRFIWRFGNAGHYQWKFWLNNTPVTMGQITGQWTTATTAATTTATADGGDDVTSAGKIQNGRLDGHAGRFLPRFTRRAEWAGPWAEPN